MASAERSDMELGMALSMKIRFDFGGEDLLARALAAISADHESRLMSMSITEVEYSVVFHQHVLITPVVGMVTAT